VDLDTDGQFDAGRYFAKVGGVGDIDWIFGSGVNKHRLIFANTSAENEVFSIADTYPTGWVHVVFTFNCPDLDTCVAQGYIDGSPVTTTQDTDFTGARRADSDYEFFHGDQVTDTVAMDGRMRLPKIWTLQLNDTQVAALAAQDVCDP
jgi:hypothetical protein